MDTNQIVDQAAKAVAEDMERKASSGSDGIWRFDRILEGVFGAEPRSKEVWREIERRARECNSKKDTWDRGGYGIVASFAQTKAAYATLGRLKVRKFMT
jgi:hypothetical protein